jgi:hypothetical protein
VGNDTKALLTDKNGRTLPQYRGADDFEKLLGRNGASRVELYGPTGQPLRTRTNTILDVASTEIEQALTTLSGLIGAISADPTANTVQARLKAIADALAGTVGVADSALATLIGEVAVNPTPNSLLARLKDLLTELQSQEYGTSQPITQTLAPSTDTLFTMSAECAYFDLINEGPGDVYIKIDGVASIGGAGCLKLLEDGIYNEYRQRGTVAHVIGPSASVVTVVGVR